ncbi:Detoxification-like protein [Thalictrum thalictroides]|uniref:Detoxification-like protein n=1 Tax=Thalictrum thalictroides TaxID=46969 RepID=A0A7J6WK12_THATH|nr:Detoxification-like protein [Thalictrum thalictroides]
MEGFSWLALMDLWPFVKLSLSSGAMICIASYFNSLEFWYNSILVLLTGYMANAEVAIDALSIWLMMIVYRESARESKLVSFIK